MKLFTLLGDHPSVKALKDGSFTSDVVQFDFADVKVPNTQFKAVVREAKYDLAELAIVTFLQAKVYRKPYSLIPVTVMGRGQLHTLYYNSARGPLAPKDLAGKRIGVRAYTQTTGAWVRGILADDYGVDSNGMTWVTFEDPHLAEYVDPPNVKKVPDTKTLEQMLLDGDVDAAILAKPPEAPLVQVFPDAGKTDHDWAARNGGVPINHMLVIRSEIVKSQPDAVREVFRLAVAAKKAANPNGAPVLDPVRLGIEANRHSLGLIIDYSVRQKLIPRAFTVNELFEDTAPLLDDL